MENENLSYIGPNNTFEYLGVKFKLREELVNESCCKGLVEASIRAKKFKLNIDLINQYIPHYLYVLTADIPTLGALELLDMSFMRSIYKAFLHLPQSTTN